MDYINISTELLHIERKRFNSSRNEYRLDMWKEVKKRWLVLGVLLAVLMAVLGPSIGAHGGPLHTEYISYFPLSYIFYNAGKRYKDSKTVSSVTTTLCIVHSQIVSPGICLLVGSLFGGLGVDYRIVRGALLTSVGGPCSWLSLCHSECVTLVASIYVTSLFVSPLAMFVLCGRATIPPLGGILSTILTSGAPFLFGVFITSQQHSSSQQHTLEQHPTHQQHTTAQQQHHRQQTVTQHDKTKVYVCCLMLLYVVCCSKLSEAAGVLDVMHVLATLALELCRVAVSACVCWLYYRCGRVPRDDVIDLIACAVPSCADAGWEVSTCPVPGFPPLPAALRAPAQALLLAARPPPRLAPPRPPPTPPAPPAVRITRYHNEGHTG